MLLTQESRVKEVKLFERVAAGPQGIVPWELRIRRFMDDSHAAGSVGCF